MKDTFIYQRYRDEPPITFHVGQKVKCYYYHEYEGFYYENKSYHRPLWQQLLDKPFKPVKFGIVMGGAGMHPYWLNSDGYLQEYLFVKFKEYIFQKAIPISCMDDAELSTQQLKKFLEETSYRIGEKGYSYESYNALMKQVEESEKFINA